MVGLSITSLPRPEAIKNGKNQMITDYKILTGGNNTTSMEQSVKREIENGFQPYGELQIVVASSGPISLFQVMVKGETQSKAPSPQS
jgi:hypothetical protein